MILLGNATSFSNIKSYLSTVTGTTVTGSSVGGTTSGTWTVYGNQPATSAKMNAYDWADVSDGKGKNFYNVKVYRIVPTTEAGSFSLSIQKVGRGSSTLLEGATFTYGGQQSGTVSTKSSGAVKFVTDQSISSATTYNYTIQETSAPEGYSIDKNWKLNIAVTTKLNNTDNTYEVESVTISKDNVSQKIEPGKTYRLKIDGSWEEGNTNDSNTLLIVSVPSSSNDMNISLTWADPPDKEVKVQITKSAVNNDNVIAQSEYSGSATATFSYGINSSADTTPSETNSFSVNFKNGESGTGTSGTMSIPYGTTKYIWIKEDSVSNPFVVGLANYMRVKISVSSTGAVTVNSVSAGKNTATAFSENYNGYTTSEENGITIINLNIANKYNTASPKLYLNKLLLGSSILESVKFEYWVSETESATPPTGAESVTFTSNIKQNLGNAEYGSTFYIWLRETETIIAETDLIDEIGLGYWQDNNGNYLEDNYVRIKVTIDENGEIDCKTQLVYEGEIIGGTDVKQNYKEGDSATGSISGLYIKAASVNQTSSTISIKIYDPLKEYKYKFRVGKASYEDLKEHLEKSEDEYDETAMEDLFSNLSLLDGATYSISWYANIVDVDDISDLAASNSGGSASASRLLFKVTCNFEYVRMSAS